MEKLNKIMKTTAKIFLQNTKNHTQAIDTARAVRRNFIVSLKARMRNRFVLTLNRFLYWWEIYHWALVSRQCRSLFQGSRRELERRRWPSQRFGAACDAAEGGLSGTEPSVAQLRTDERLQGRRTSSGATLDGGRRGVNLGETGLRELQLGPAPVWGRVPVLGVPPAARKPTGCRAGVHLRKLRCLVMSVHKHGPSYTTIFQDKRSLHYAHTYTLSNDLT